MKRFIYTTIALAAVAVGCTKSNLVEGPQSMETPIEFETYNGRTPLTKASEITNTSIQADGFHVTAFYDVNNSVYMDRDVTWSGNAWTYSPKAYWPSTGDLDFVAYGLNAASYITPAEDHLSFTYTVPDVVSQQKDLVASKFGDSSKSTDNSTVTINMQHLLSKIGFQVKTIYTGTAPDAQVEIQNIKLKGTFKTIGTVNLKPGTDESFMITPVTENQVTVSEYSLFTSDEGFTAGASASSQAIFNNSIEPEFEENMTDEEKQEAEDAADQLLAASLQNRYMMIMPGSVGAAPYIEVTYKLTGQNEFQTARVDLPSTEVEQDGGETVTSPWTFKAGTAYEFIFTVSISSIDFTGEIVDWDEEHDDYIQNI